MLFLGLAVGYIACYLMLRPNFDWLHSEIARLRKSNRSLQERVDSFQSWLDKSGL